MLEPLTQTLSPSLPSSYGFDDVALIPGMETLDPELCDRTWSLDSRHTFDLPILAAAMDGVVDPDFAVQFHRQGGLAVLNLEGLHGRYADPAPVYERIASAAPEEAPTLLQELYTRPLDADFVRLSVQRVKQAGARLAVSATPVHAEWLLPIAMEEGADIVVVQSTVTSARHVSRSGPSLDLEAFCRRYSVPVMVGNTVSYEPALELMRAGAAAILVGVGPGAECTSREVLGIGMPQISATLEVAAARDEFARQTGRYVSIVTDGGMRVSGDMVKALAAGADAVMLGAPLAQAAEAPGRGFNWGMASFHGTLPRGTRIHVGTTAPLQQILYGPSTVNSGTQNLAGAIHTAMAVLGARTIRELHGVRMIHAPAIKTEGKLYQLRGNL
ncbi:MAG TPA: GuaB3 family IMP dehydrogenase-related protein [Chloroflexota bacterium]